MSNFILFLGALSLLTVVVYVIAKVRQYRRDERDRREIAASITRALKADRERIAIVR